MAIVAVAHHRVLLLSSGIENVEQARLLVDSDRLAIDILDGGCVTELVKQPAIGLGRILRTIVVLHEMGRNEHAGEGALAYTTATNDYNLVLGHEVKRCGGGGLYKRKLETKCTNRQRRRGILRGKPATPQVPVKYCLRKITEPFRVTLLVN